MEIFINVLVKSAPEAPIIGSDREMACLLMAFIRTVDQFKTYFASCQIDVVFCSKQILVMRTKSLFSANSTDKRNSVFYGSNHCVLFLLLVNKGNYLHKAAYVREQGAGSREEVWLEHFHWWCMEIPNP